MSVGLRTEVMPLLGFISIWVVCGLTGPRLARLSLHGRCLVSLLWLTGLSVPSKTNGWIQHCQRVLLALPTPQQWTSKI